MMEELAVIRDVAERLEQGGLPYMLTGSLAMSFYAQPRMTRDVDLVVEMGGSNAAQLVTLFEDAYYVSSESVREALSSQSMFNLIHLESLIKVDVIVRKEEPYRQLEFARREKVRIGDAEVYIVSKEDLILSKLWWARDSHSEMQIRDVENLIGTGFDRRYVGHWARELGLMPWAERWIT